MYLFFHLKKHKCVFYNVMTKDKKQIVIFQGYYHLIIVCVLISD